MLPVLDVPKLLGGNLFQVLGVPKLLGGSGSILGLETYFCSVLCISTNVRNNHKNQLLVPHLRKYEIENSALFLTFFIQ